MLEKKISGTKKLITLYRGLNSTSFKGKKQPITGMIYLYRYVFLLAD